MDENNIAEAFALLKEMRAALDGMIHMTSQMAEAAKRCEAPALAFSAQMMVESVESFRDEMTRFVFERAVP